MAHRARAAFRGLPHDVAQRANGRRQMFFGDGDYLLYRELLAEPARGVGAEFRVGADVEPRSCDRGAVGR